MATLAAVRVPRPAAPAEPAAVPQGPLADIALLLRFGFAMAAALAAASLPASALVTVREVAVTGARAVPAREIVERSGVRRGARLSAVEPAVVAQRVAAIPRIARAEVTVALGGRVTIHVEERAARAAVPYRGRYLVLDPSGVVMDVAAGPGRLPVLVPEPFAPAWMRPGHRLPDPNVALALRALEALPAEALAPGARLRVREPGDLALITPDRIVVRLGRLRGLDARAALLPELLRAVRGRGIPVEYIDLSFAGSVAMKPLAWPGGGERP